MADAIGTTWLVRAVGARLEITESKEAEARLNELLLPCYIHILMIAAIAQRQAATLTWMVSVKRGFIAESPRITPAQSVRVA
jgi:hypothetical protein